MYEQMHKPQNTASPPLQMKTDDYFGAAKKSKGRNPYEGAPIQVSGALADRIRDGFGIQARELKLRESPQVAEMGARATAQGDAIRFAPGEFRPDTSEGMAILGHELSHIREQAAGNVHANIPGSDIHYDAGHEAASDRAGEAFASGGLGAAEPVSLAGSNAYGAPVQGFGEGIGKWFRNLFGRGDSAPAGETAPGGGTWETSELYESADRSNPLFGGDDAFPGAPPLTPVPESLGSIQPGKMDEGEKPSRFDRFKRKLTTKSRIGKGLDREISERDTKFKAQEKNEDARKKWEALNMEADPRLYDLTIQLRPLFEHMKRFPKEYAEQGYPEHQQKSLEQVDSNLKYATQASHNFNRQLRMIEYYTEIAAEAEKKFGKTDKKAAMARARIAELKAELEGIASDSVRFFDPGNYTREETEAYLRKKFPNMTEVQLAAEVNKRKSSQDATHSLVRMYNDPSLPADAILDTDSGAHYRPQALAEMQFTRVSKGDGRQANMGSDFKPTMEFGRPSFAPIVNKKRKELELPRMPAVPEELPEQPQVAAVSDTASTSQSQSGKKGKSSGERRYWFQLWKKKPDEFSISAPPANTSIDSALKGKKAEEAQKQDADAALVQSGPERDIYIDPTNVVHYGTGGSSVGSRTAHMKQTQSLIGERGENPEGYHSTIDDLNRTIGITPDMFDNMGIFRKKLEENIDGAHKSGGEDTPAKKEAREWKAWLSEPSRKDALFMSEMTTDQFLVDQRLDENADERKDEAAFEQKPMDSDTLSREIDSGHIDEATGERIMWKQEAHKANQERKIEPQYVKWTPRLRKETDIMVNTIDDGERKASNAAIKEASEEAAIHHANDGTSAQEVKQTGETWAKKIIENFWRWMSVVQARFWRLTSLIGLDFFVNRGKKVLFSRADPGASDYQGENDKRRRFITDSEWRHVQKMKYEEKGYVERLNIRDKLKDERSKKQSDMGA